MYFSFTGKDLGTRLGSNKDLCLLDNKDLIFFFLFTRSLAEVFIPFVISKDALPSLAEDFLSYMTNGFLLLIDRHRLQKWKCIKTDVLILSSTLSFGRFCDRKLSS